MPVGKVIGIRIEDYNEWKRDDLKLDLSKLEKEQMFAGNVSWFVFHDKKVGVAVEIDGDDIESVTFFPPITSRAKGCKNDRAKDFINEKSWFGKLKLEERTREQGCGSANVTAISLSGLEITALGPKQVDVVTTAVDPQGDTLVYAYKVSGGRIIGSGAKVRWDLSGLAAGTYTITGAVDDGCGFCGRTQTQTVVVR